MLYDGASPPDLLPRSAPRSVPPHTPAAPRAQRTVSHCEEDEGADAAQPFDLFADMPRALSPPAQSQQPSPAGSALFDADDDA
eukprot:5822086-Prymnesium_polylepis.1